MDSVHSKKILVIIVTYNAMTWLDRCLLSINNSSVKADAMIIDNGSKDGTQKHIKENYSSVIFVQSDKNLGFGKANNIGFEYAIKNGYDYVYLLNQDAWVKSDTFENLICLHQDNQEYGILSPIQMQANERYIDKNFCMYTMSYNSNNDIISDLYNGQPRDIYPVSFVMAAHWLVSMECLKKVGGFSPSFPHYGEDNNFIDRAVYHGFKVGICPQLKVVHDREYRIVSNEQKAYFAYSSCLVALSKPEYTRNKNVIYPFYYFLREALCANSLRGFKYIGRIYKEYSSIKKNRLVSKGKMPFLFMK